MNMDLLGRMSMSHSISSMDMSKEPLSDMNMAKEPMSDMNMAKEPMSEYVDRNGLNETNGW